MKTPYNLSRDYNMLYRLAKAGFDIPCWVEGRFSRQVSCVIHIKDGCVGVVSDKFFFYPNDKKKEQSEFVSRCEKLNLEYIKPTLQDGEWIIADVIGLGIYEIVCFDDHHVNVKLKKRFLDGWRDRDHITCCHCRPVKIDMVKWLTFKRVKRP